MRDSLTFLVTVAVTMAAIPLFTRVAPKWGLVDEPSGRRLHEGNVPLVGGIVMGIVFLCGYWASGLVRTLSLYLPLAIAITLIGGLLDDRHEFKSRTKLIFQLAAAGALVLGDGAVLTHLGQLVSEHQLTLGRWSIPVTIFAVIGIMNAMNMVDGMDGLAGTLALAACLCFGFAAVASGNAPVFSAIGITAGVLLGFLVYNARTPWRSRALIFMGDTGSLFLGLVLASFAISLAMAPQPAFSPIVAPWIIGLPVADTLTIMTRRLIRGRHPFHADREHLHHILLALGLSEGQVVVVLFIVALILGMGALTADLLGVPSYVSFSVAIGGLVLYGITAEILCRRLVLRNHQQASQGVTRETV